MGVAIQPQLMRAIEKLDYVVTVGDVASQAGLALDQTRQELLNLASVTQGHLQVATSGEMVFEFSPQFRTILRNHSWRTRLNAWGAKVWGILFYLIRISFGIILILSIVLMLVAIAAIFFALSSQSSGDRDGGGHSQSNSRGGSFFFFPIDFFGDIFIWLIPTGHDVPARHRRSGKADKPLNFLEAIFSFLFGDGNPDADLETRRWQLIGTAIRQQQGAIAAEQLAPYLDNITPLNQETEDYIIPVLARFNGFPQVSPRGGIIYTFPDLQISAQSQEHRGLQSYLRETPWTFSQATKGQLTGAIALGCVNLVLAIFLGSLLQSGSFDASFIQFIQGIYSILLAYAIGFLGIPLIRYGWLKRRNQKLMQRNRIRQTRTQVLKSPDDDLQEKLTYAKDWQQSQVIASEQIVYRTDQEMRGQTANQLPPL